MALPRIFIFASLAILLIVVPVINFVIIRSNIASYRDLIGFGKGGKPAIHHAYLPAIKMPVVKEFLSKPDRKIVSLGNSSFLYISEKRLAGALNCELPAFYNASNHSNDITSYRIMLESMYGGLTADDTLVIGITMDQFFEVGRNRNIDLFAPWLNETQAIVAAMTYNRRLVFPQVIELNAYEFTSGYFSNLYGLVTEGPTYQEDDEVAADGSAKFPLEDIVEHLRAEGRHLPPHSREIQRYLARDFGPPQLDELARFSAFIKNSKAQIVFLDFVPYQLIKATEAQFSAFNAQYDQLKRKYLSDFTILNYSASSNYENFLDETHLSPEGVKMALDRIKFQLDGDLCPFPPTISQ